MVGTVRFLGRSTSTAESTTADADATVSANGPADAVRTTGKGRPTPKRRDAEAKRRGPAPPPPRTQREAARLARTNRPNKDEQRRLSAERRAGMARGDQKYLMARDRGPVKEYVRDVVDSRPHLMGLFMPLAAIVVLSIALQQVPAIQQFLSLFSLIALIVMILEGAFLGYTVTKKARARFPEQSISTLGTGWYAFTRASQLRRLRVPKPRVARGANP